MNLKAKIRALQPTIGSWITIGHPVVAEIMADCGFDWLTVDMEHSAIDYNCMQELITVIQSGGVKALVRVFKNDEVAIKKAMDAGADGVIVPMVNSASDARKAVAFTMYPPEGNRGVGLYRAQGYGERFEEYRKWLKEEAVIIAQIEHIDAVNCIESILDVDGIDAFFIGPYDLSGSMGHPGEFERPEVREALSRFQSACVRLNRAMGFHVIQPEATELKKKLDQGYTFTAFSIDSLFLGRSARRELEKIRNT